MKIGVADATEENFDLHVALGGIASRNCRRGQWRCLTGSGIGFRLIGAWMHTRILFKIAAASRDAFSKERSNRKIRSPGNDCWPSGICYPVSDFFLLTLPNQALLVLHRDDRIHPRGAPRWKKRRANGHEYEQCDCRG